MNNIIQMNSSKKNFWIFFSILIILTLLMIFCYHPINGLYYGDDYLFHFNRFTSLMKALNTNSFPVYIDYDGPEGFGYTARWFYPDLLLIPFAYIANMTSFIFGFKFMLFSITILCGLSMYLLINRIFRNQFTAIIGSIVYTFALYRLFDLFNRYALGESFSFIFLPIIFLGLYEIINGNYKKWYILTIGFTLLIFSHLLSAVLTFIFLLIFILIFYKRFIETPKRFLYLVISGVVTVITISYFLLPFIEQTLSQQFYYQTAPPEISAHSHKQPISSTIQGLFYGFVPTSEEPLLEASGLIMTLLICLRIFVRSKKNSLLKLADIGIIISVICILLTSEIAPWARFPLKYLSFIQFPWRLFEYSTFFISISGAYYLTLLTLKINKKALVFSFIIILSVISIFINGYSYRNIEFYATFPEENFETHFGYGNMEYVPRNFPSYPGLEYPYLEYIQERSGIVKSEKGISTISNFKKENGIISLNVDVNGSDVIELPTFYYKGYSAKLNGQDIEFRQSKEGLIEIPVNQSGNIQVAYTGTFIQKYSIYITLLCFILLLVYIINVEKNLKNKETLIENK